MAKINNVKNSDPGMEARLRRYFTLALVVFVIVNILALVLVLNAYLKNTGDVTRFLPTVNPSNPTQNPNNPNTPTTPAVVDEKPLLIAIPQDGESVFIHLKPENASCTTKVAHILEDHGLIIDTEISDPLDEDDQTMGLIAVRKNISSISTLQDGLGAVKREAFGCLDTSITLTSTGTQTEGGFPIVKTAAAQKINAAFLDDEDDSDEDDWIEFDSLGGPQLGQSIPLIHADVVKKSVAQGGLGIDGTGVDVCIIDTGIETGTETSTTFNQALPPIVNGFVPKAPKGYKTEYNPDDSKAEFKKAWILEDADTVNGHGTAMAGIIAAIGGSDQTSKPAGVAPKINLMIAKLPKENTELGSYKTSKTNFLKALKFCLGKNKDTRKADVIFTGFSFSDIADKSTEQLDLFTENWQVFGDKNPADKKQKGDKSNNIESVTKMWDKYGKKSKPKKSDPYLVPLVVPVGNLANGKTMNGLPNSLAFLPFAIAVGSSADATFGSTQLSSNFPAFAQCTDATLAPDQVLCNTACHTNVDVVAPGHQILTTTLIAPIGAQDFAPYSVNYIGTSVAAAHVAGVLALMEQANPNLTVDQIQSKLKATATSTNASGVPLWTAFGVPQTCYGSGVVNALTAVQSAQSG